MPYRDDRAALEARREQIQRALSDAAQKVDALSEAVSEKEKLTRELADVRKRLERAGARLPLLESVRIASPCSASWDAMNGDERVRFCGKCEKNVYNLSAMSGDEAERLLARHGESICVRLYKRADGTVLTADCPVGVRRKRVKGAVLATAGAGAMALSATAFFARQGAPVVSTPMMGTAAAVAPSAPPVAGSPSVVAITGTAAVSAEPAPVLPARKAALRRR